MVLEYMKCSASAMWMWWSCDEYVYNICSIISAKNGNRNIKIYCTLKCSGDGLVMIKICKVLHFNMKNDKLNGISYLNSSYM